MLLVETLQGKGGRGDLISSLGNYRDTWRCIDGGYIYISKERRCLTALFERKSRLYRWLSRDKIEGAKAWRFSPWGEGNVTAEAPGLSRILRMVMRKKAGKRHRE